MRPHEWHGTGAVHASPTRPLTVAVVNDYQIVVEGLAAMLAPHRPRIEIVRVVIGEDIGVPVDVALFDTYGRIGVAEPALRTLTDHRAVRHVAIFSLDFPAPVLTAASVLGVRSFISKALDADEVLAALERTAAGEEVRAVPEARASSNGSRRVWPGSDDGLTERESQTLVLLAEGLSNAEIARALFVNVETVRSRLKRVYRKLGLRNRAEAVAYVIGAGAFRRWQPAHRMLDEHPDGSVDEPPASAG